MSAPTAGGATPPPRHDVEALVTVTESDGRRSREAELTVHTLGELYDTCRGVPAGRLVWVHLRGAHGEVRLHFASLIRPGDPEERA